MRGSWVASCCWVWMACSASHAGVDADGVCARAAAASPVQGTVAFGLRGRTWVAVGADGRERALHRFFADGTPDRAEIVLRGAGAWNAALAWAPGPACPASCPYDVEAAVMSPTGEVAVWRGRSTGWVPVELVGGGKLLVAGDPTSLWVDPAAGTVRPLEGYVGLVFGEADDDAWQPAWVGWGGASGFVRPSDGRVETIPAPVPDHPDLWGAAWVYAAPAGDGSYDLAIADGVTVERIPLTAAPAAAAAEFAVRIAGDRALLTTPPYDRFPRPLAVVDLDTREVVPLSAPPDPAAPRTPFQVSTYGDEALVQGRGIPYLRVDLVDGTVQAVDWRAGAPRGAEPFLPPEHLFGSVSLVDGRLVLPLRAPQAGAYVASPVDGRLERIGRPVHDVAWVGARRFGATWAVRASAAEAPWDEPAAPGAIEGTSVQLLRGDSSWVYRDARASLSDDGTCALVADPSGVRLVDLAGDAEVPVDPPLDPSYVVTAAP